MVRFDEPNEELRGIPVVEKKIQNMSFKNSDRRTRRNSGEINSLDWIRTIMIPSSPNYLLWKSNDFIYKSLNMLKVIVMIVFTTNADDCFSFSQVSYVICVY